MPQTHGVMSDWSFLDYIRLFFSKWKKIVVIVVVSVSLTGVVTFFMTPLYKAEVLLLPVSSSSKANNGMMGSLSSVGVGGLSSVMNIFAGGGKDINRLKTILKSRTVSERVVSELNLLPKLFPDRWDEKNGRWKVDHPDKQPTIQSGVGRLRKKYVEVDLNKREQTLKLTVYFGDPQLVAKIANAYTDALQWFINTNSLTTAKRNRIYIGEQLRVNNEKLLEAGKEIKALYNESNVSAREADIDVEIDDLPGNVADTELQLATLLNKSNEINNKIEEMKVIKDVPQQVYLSYVKMQNQMLARVNAMLLTQYEMAKIQENKEELAFEIVDHAIVPRGVYKPKPLLMCMAAGLISLAVAMFLVVLLERYRLEKSNALC